LLLTWRTGGGSSGPSGPVPLSSIPAAHEELPFELRALEIALDTVSQYLERLTGDLEAAAHPALDALTGKVCGRKQISWM
jgi:magnesium transporter